VTLIRVSRKHVATAVQSVPPVVSLYRWQRDRVGPRLHAYVHDRRNRARYGPEAPMFAERLWVDPRQVQHYLLGIGGSGHVRLEAWPTSAQTPIEDDPILKTSIARWALGLPWEETGELERMERIIEQRGPIKGCRTRADILERCARLDEIFHMIEREGRVRPLVEIEPQTFREFGGIGMHIGEGGVPVRDVNGRHRFAMARILQISPIPVRIGVVHHSALRLLPELRRTR
jgi:hypothetical protein